MSCAGILAAADAVELFEYARLNRLLDERIRQLSGHPTAVGVLERLHAQGLRHQFRLAFHPGRAAAFAPERAAIIEAIAARDPDAAEAATRAHLDGVIRALRVLG